MAEHQVLFCPFCRECFEGCTTCPAHELRLVPLAALPRDAAPRDADDALDEHDEVHVAPDDRRLSLLDPGRGRALVAVAAALNAASLLLPLLVPARGAALRTYEVARALPSLWGLGLLAFTALFVLARRRTPRKLRALRVLVPLLALIGVGTAGWARWKLGPAVQSAPALYVVLLASALMLCGGLRLGGPARTDAA